MGRRCRRLGIAIRGAIGGAVGCGSAVSLSCGLRLSCLALIGLFTYYYFLSRLTSPLLLAVLSLGCRLVQLKHLEGEEHIITNPRYQIQYSFNIKISIVAIIRKQSHPMSSKKAESSGQLVSNSVRVTSLPQRVVDVWHRLAEKE